MSTTVDEPRDSWPPPSRAIGLEAYRTMLAADPSLAGPPPGSLAWEAGGDRIVALAWARAILWQLAHPLIARAIVAHSTFDASAASRLARYEHTRRAQLALAFGDPASAWAVAQHIDGIHGRIHGTATIDGHAYRYSARDPELLAWVYATLVDSTLLVFQRFVRPVGRDEARAYLHQASALGPLLGAPGAFPDRIEGLTSFWRRMESSALRVTDDARAVAGDLLRGLPIPVLGRVINPPGRLLLAGLLPPWLRAAYGLRWGRGREAALRGAARVARGVYPRLPSAIRRWPEAPRRERRAPRLGI